MENKWRIESGSIENLETYHGKKLRNYVMYRDKRLMLLNTIGMTQHQLAFRLADG